MSREVQIAKTVLWSMLTVALLGVTALFVIDRADRSRQTLPVIDPVPAFQFTERNGEPFGLDDFAGKISLVDFIFTNCQGPCPVMGANMAMLYRFYEHSPSVQFVSISVDPARDSLNVLQAYARSLGVDDNRWKFLNGPLPAVKKLSEDGFHLAADQLPMGHSTRFVLVDQKAQIRAYYDGNDLIDFDKLHEDIRNLAGEKPAPVTRNDY